MTTATLNPMHQLFSGQNEYSKRLFGQSYSQEAQQSDSSALPESFTDWLKATFPTYVSSPLGAHHEAYWRWLWSIEKGVEASPSAILGIWPRGGAKSTSAELGCVALGARRKRRYALYVSGTQDQADNHVLTIGSMLESPAIAKHYPELSNRQVSKYGSSRGWRRNRLWTADGMIVDAIGLDKNVRGLKLEDARPDLIILDDIDALGDSLDTTQKKLDALTHSILPAGSNDVVIIAIQNLIIPDGVFSQVIEGKSEMLADRLILGPIPAVEDLTYREQENGPALITGGRPSWVGQSLEDCQRFVNKWGITAFLEECQHEVGEVGKGELVYPRFWIKEPPVPWEQCKWKLASGDPGGHDATVFLPVGVDQREDIYVYDEFYERNDVNDQTIHDFLSRWPGVTHLPIGETGGNFMINTLIRLGWNAFKPDMGRGSGFSTVRGMIDNRRLFISPKCKRLIGEMKEYRFKLATDPHTGERYATAIPGDRHADGPDALRYAVMTIAHGVPAAGASKPVVLNFQRARSAR